MALGQDARLKGLLAQREDLLCYIRAIVGDPSLVEDVFQEVALAAIGQSAEIEDQRHLDGWLRTTARNQALAALRRAKRERLLDDGALDALDRRWPEVEDPPELEALRACCEKLSPASRRLLALRYEHDHDGAAMSAAIGRPLNTIYVTMSRIHRSLVDCVRQRLGAVRVPDAAG